jgi:gliding motility-associated-like protein
MNKAALLLLMFFVSCAAYAQSNVSQPQGTFTVNQIEACAPFTLVVSAPTCNGSVGCDISYTGQNSNFQTFSLTGSHTYTTPGTYTVRLIRGTQEDQLQIRVVQNIAPAIQVFNCGNNNVSVTVTDTNYDDYRINFNDGSPEVTVKTGIRTQHAYATPGSKTISVRGINAGAFDNCSSTIKTITTVASVAAPTISRLEVLDNSNIRLAFTNVPDVQYRLEIATNNSNTFQQIKTLSNRTADTVRNLRTDDNFYCFRIGAFDPCANQTFYSNTICSANLDLEVQNNQNRVTWATSTAGVSTFRITRSTPASGQSISTNVAASPYLDSDVNCGTEYCYQLTTFYSNNSQSVSLLKCGTAISNDIPASISDISTVVNQNGIDILWKVPNNFTPSQYSIFKSSGENYTLLSNTPAPPVNDPSYVTGSGSCYKLSYVDVCENQSEQSREACPLVLTGNVESDNTVTLTWSAYDGYQSGVHHYTVEIYTPNGTLLQSVDVQGTTFTDVSEDLTVQTYVYVVKAIPNTTGLPPSVSNSLPITKDPNLFYPTAFTPNGDNLNDIFNVYGQYITSFEMDIFNRWGELMFTTTDLSVGWDGKFKGNLMPEGTYTFVATITDFAGRTIKKSGSVLLLRKN